MRNLFLPYCYLLLLFWEIALSQNKYYETRLNVPVRSDLYCVIAESDSIFSVIGRYALYIGLFDKNYSYFAKSQQFSMETTITYYEVDTIGGDLGVYDIVRTENGYVATGYISTNEVDEYYYIFLLHLDNEGSIIDMQNITPNNNASLGYSIAQNTEGDLFIGGYYTPPFISPNRDKLYLTKLNPIGEKLWEYTNWSYPYNCAFRAVLPAPDGGCYAAGYVNLDPPVTGDFFFIKINAAGAAVWEKVYSFNTVEGGSNALGMAATYDNGFVLCGSSNYGHARLLKTNSVGDSIWSKEYFPNEQISSFLKVAVLPDNMSATH